MNQNVTSLHKPCMWPPLSPACLPAFGVSNGQNRNAISSRRLLHKLCTWLCLLPFFQPAFRCNKFIGLWLVKIEILFPWGGYRGGWGWQIREGWVKLCHTGTFVARAYSNVVVLVSKGEVMLSCRIKIMLIKFDKVQITVWNHGRNKQGLVSIQNIYISFKRGWGGWWRKRLF